MPISHFPIILAKTKFLEPSNQFSRAASPLAKQMFLVFSTVLGPGLNCENVSYKS